MQHAATPVGTVVRPGRAVDLRLTLGVLSRMHGRDPSIRVGRGAVERATRTPAGPVAMRLAQASSESVEVTAWGPGAEWAIAQAPILLGARDDDSGFTPRHPLLRDLHRHLDGLRICRTENVFEALVAAVLRQKVTSVEAGRAWVRMMRALGEAAPGPLGLTVPPDPARVARTPSWAFHRFGVERRRAETLHRVALVAHRLEEAVGMDPSSAGERLRLIPGIGEWTAAEVLMEALGDADAVPVGDYHLPNLVSWALAGEPRGDDRRMLDLLAPYAGHRGRVLRLLMAGGPHAPRWGPRLAARDIASI
jgi:3-methyladenine DNA glycosylase/8-oxoguanine DNA glycosylase